MNYKESLALLIQYVDAEIKVLDQAASQFYVKKDFKNGVIAQEKCTIVKNIRLIIYVSFDCINESFIDKNYLEKIECIIHNLKNSVNVVGNAGERPTRITDECTSI